MNTPILYFLPFLHILAPPACILSFSVAIIGLYHKIISLPSRVKSMKDLSDSLKTLIGLEREAYSIENKAETKEVTHNVMLVPTSDNVDDWEAAAQKQQDGVLGG